MKVNGGAKGLTQFDSSEEPKGKKNNGVKNLFKTLFTRPSSSGKSPDNAKNSLRNQLSEFNKAESKAKEVLIKNNNSPTTHITKDNLSPKKSNGVPATKPRDARPQYSEKNQDLMNSLKKSMTEAVPLKSFNMDWRTNPEDRKRNAHMFEQVNRWKIEIELLINKIASSAILDKSERPKAGQESLSSLKDQLVSTLRKASDYCHNDDSSTDDFNQNLEALGQILRDIDPDQKAGSNKANENPKAPKYIPQPPVK